nr:MAG TPA: hypothetical protein [Caudoviricetes sp.]
MDTSMCIHFSMHRGISIPSYIYKLRRLKI